MRKTMVRCVVAGATMFVLSSGVSADAAKGKAFFNDHNGGACNGCHFVDGRKMVGPGLKGVADRHSDEWLKQFLSDPQAIWKSNHSETLELKARVRKKRAPRTLCRKSPMSEEQLTDLVDYLKSLE